jgi:preprotein translocase subunit SecD
MKTKNKSFNYRLTIFVFATIFGIIFSAPTLLQTEIGKKVTLGLDLQGGLYMLLGVKTEEAINSKIKSIASSIKYFTDHNNIIITGLATNGDKINFTLLDKSEESNLDKMLSDIPGLVKNKTNLNYELAIDNAQKEITKTDAVSQAVETIRNRLNEFGLSEPSVSKQGEENILVELPGVRTQEEEQRARDLIARPARLQFMAVDESRMGRVYSMSNEEAALYGSVILPDAKQDGIKYIVKAIPILDGSMLTDAYVGRDESNRPQISFSLNSQGGRIFGDFTGNNIGKRLAIVLDDKVYSAPNIQSRIGGGSGVITGNYGLSEANDLAIVLKSGALLAPVMMLEKRSIGPSLGADSVKSSLIALISGFLAVAIFMVFYYRLAGLIATIALLSNLIILVALLAVFGATLTLPGMAGIILSVAMGIDANVIINERIRELFREGASVRKAFN